jgi:hypothetical protein
MCFAENMGDYILQVAPRIVTRCLSVCQSTIGQEMAFRRGELGPDGQQVEKPEWDLMSTAVDLLTSIVMGLEYNTKDLLKTNDFVPVLPEILDVGPDRGG